MSAYTAVYERVLEVIRSLPEVQETVGEHVYQGVAPSDTTHPLVLVQPYSARDVMTIGREHSATQVDVKISVVFVNAPSLVPLETIYDAIDEALIHAPVEPSSRGVVSSIHRIREVETAEYTPAGPVRTLGAIYRTLVS